MNADCSGRSKRETGALMPTPTSLMSVCENYIF